MAEIDLGNVMGPQGEDGSQWYWGTAITGTSTSGAVFSSSGITNARVNDKYYNTSTSNIYTCTTAGAASVARWAYIGNIKGEQGNIGPAGPTGSVDFTTPITFSIAGTRSDLASGDSIATLFGKTQKWFADINSGGASTLLATNLSANRALISNANGKVAVSSVTSTELGYLDGVTSAIQTQLNTINTSIGTLSDLTTTAKSSLVAAANELNGKTISEIQTLATGVSISYNGVAATLSIDFEAQQAFDVGWNSIATIPSKLRPKVSYLRFSLADNYVNTNEENHPIFCRISNGDVAVYAFPGDLTMHPVGSVTYVL